MMSDYWEGNLFDGEQGSVFSAPQQLIDQDYAPSGSVSARARQAYAAEALRQKDHVAAGLLAIFLGVFGVHKFYLGCNQAGFIMLAVPRAACGDMNRRFRSHTMRRGAMGAGTEMRLERIYIKSV